MTVTNNKRADKVWIIVPAAGSGRRMGSERPKQYLSLMGETVIEKTLNRLLA
ncbi:MAG: 2-C-methyl-D-erythritol 4-phosphate cytidylyltransferase, partial [Cellvibrionaceae bacterium]